MLRSRTSQAKKRKNALRTNALTSPTSWFDRVVPYQGLGIDSFHSVIRRLLRDDDVVHVPFAMARRGHANEPRIALQRPNVGAAAIAHPCPQTADELVDHRSDAALVRDPPFDAFRYELLARLGIRVEIEFILEVAVAAAAPHGADRSHAAVLLEAPPLVEDHLARTFVGAGEEA